MKQALLIPNPFRYGAVLAINAYQRYVSPYKGFTCAHRYLYKGDSCSQYIKRLVAEASLEDAWIATKVRFQECREANIILKNTGNIGSGQDELQEKKKRKPQDCSCGNNWGDSCEALRCLECIPDTKGLDCNPFDGDGCGFDCSALDCGSFDCGGCGN
jgi:putative component of membrane protein insertase Oxa1/YidC/SpoIIIJ protein YidD